MPDFRVAVTEALRCSKGTVLSPDGRRLVLPDGRTLSPWITLEIDEDRDLGIDEMLALGIDPGLDIDRTIEPLDEHG